MKKKKSPLVAALMSGFAFPGLGQVYAKSYIKGLIFIIVSAVFFIFIASPIITGASSYASQLVNLESANPPAFTLPNAGGLKWYSILLSIVWIVSMVDAWFCAKRLNKHIDEVVPDEKSEMSH